MLSKHQIERVIDDFAGPLDLYLCLLCDHDLFTARQAEKQFNVDLNVHSDNKSPDLLNRSLVRARSTFLE